MRRPLRLCAAFLTLVRTPSMTTVVATFADPGSTSFSFVDNVNNSDGIGDLTASISDISVNLPVLGLTFTDASRTQLYHDRYGWGRV